MKKILYILPFALLMLFSACDKNKDADVGESTLTMDLEFVYGSDDFNLYQIYTNDPFEYDLKIENLKLYLSALSLIDSEGISHSISDVLFFNAADSINSVSFTVPALHYTSLVFSIGVPPALNGTDNENFNAALFSQDHPLSLNNGMYWTWNSGYRFVLIDGRCNTNPNEDEEFETLVSIHTGKDYCYRTKTVDLDLQGQNGNSMNISFVVDVAKFFTSSNDHIDLAIDNQSHGTNEVLANRISDNILLSINPK
jgi:hypothetical protein